jgi:hypothetical protein
MSLQLLVIMVPVFFGFMGFAIDFGRMYLIRGELNQAANAMALAAAAQLSGSIAADTNTLSVMPPPLGTGPSYNYNFGTVGIGVGAGILSSSINPPACFATVSDAGSGSGNSTDCADPTAQFVNVTVTGDAPLLFWSLLPGGESRKATVAAQAVAGISAPLCTACNITPIGILSLDDTDTVNFGFGDPSASPVYSFYYSCTGTPPTILSGSHPYFILNRNDTNSSLTENDQIFADSAVGIAASTTPNPDAANASTPFACVNIGDTEQAWDVATPRACTTVAPPLTSVQSALCGLYSRLSNSDPGTCAVAVDDYASLAANLPFDSDTSVTVPGAPYSGYSGNGRRIFTAAIIAQADGITVLGFRQFLVMPVFNDGATTFLPSDVYGRFPALYIGNPTPVQTGWFDARFANACPVGAFSGPGKVVLHQ